MGQSKLELAVGTGQWDAGLKKAQQALNAFTQSQGGLQQALEKDNGDMQKFIQMMGKMESTANTAKGQMNEYKKVLEQLTAQYNQMSDAQKNSIGQDYLKTIESIKVKYQEAKSQVDTFNKSLGDSGESAKGTSGILDQLKDRFTVNVDAVKMFQMGLSAAKAALDVAKDAFFASESNVDDWGRTIASAESIYEGFLQSLNTGDFSGFLGHLDEIIKKAKDAYNALDELQTRMTIINPERTRLQARATELKAIIRRQGADSQAGQAAQTELKQLEGMLTQAFKTESQLNMNAFKAQVDKKLQEAGIKLGKRDYDFLMRTFSSDASYMAMRRGASGSVQMNYEAGGSYDEGSVSKIDTRNINQRLLDLFTDEWRKEYAPLLNAAFSARGGAASTMLSDARYLKGGGGSGGGSGHGGAGVDINSLISGQFDKAMFKANIGVDTLKPEDFIAPPSVWEQYAEGIKGTFDSIGDSMDNLTQWTKNFDPYKEKMDELTMSAQQQKAAMNLGAQAAQNFGAALQGIEDPSAKAAGTVTQAIASIALGFAMASSNANTAGTGWGWLAWLAAGMSAMATTIGTVHSLTGYAEGGEIKGNSYSGDNIAGLVDGKQLIGLNAGEIVLNQAQQANVAHGLQGAGGNLHLEGILQGENILISTNRTAKRKGYGELMFWQGG